MTWRELTVEKLYELHNVLLIDVRSPCEHAAENIPGSINVPLLDDAERAHVGTVYAQEGEILARRLALRIVSPKVPSIVDLIVSLRHSRQQIVVHCWRGGLRSEAVASYLAIVGIDCFKLVGGYKAWRKMVLSDFAADKYRFNPIVLHGQTGAGKTDILTQLAVQGAKTLDLEKLGNHRGSVFGGLGLTEQPSQKNFDGQLWSQLRTMGEESLFLEAEGRRIGRLDLPDFMLKRINNGRPILVATSLETRTNRILREYSDQFGENHNVVQEGLARLGDLRERLGANKVNALKDLVANGDLSRAIEFLLTEYYDPLYAKEIRRFEPYSLVVPGDDPSQAATDVLNWCRSLENRAPV